MNLQKASSMLIFFFLIKAKVHSAFWYTKLFKSKTKAMYSNQRLAKQKRIRCL